MSEHSLPPDPESWPSDPYRLLGVDRQVSARDLRKAYHRLIRAYKPEHSPEEFKRIRDAYEATLPYAQHLDRLRGQSANDPDRDPAPAPESPPWKIVTPRPEPTRPDPKPDAWELACRGDPASAYRTLVDRSAGNPRDEEPYLQLYWLLAVVPALDTARLPVDWLIRGVFACGMDSPRLRELLKREIAADPTLATGNRTAALLRRKTPPSLVIDVASGRWRAARMTRSWGLILSDLHAIRTWLPETDPDAWARLLIAASGHLAWAEGPAGDDVGSFIREVERLADRRRDYADDLYQVEFIQVVKAGMNQLGGRTGSFAGIFPLLAISWDERGPEFRSRLRAYTDQVAQEPRASLACLDHIHSVAPAVLARLSTLLGGLDFEEYRFLGPGVFAELAPVIERFLSSTRWTDYAVLRPNLLQFCLREAISPGLVARTLAERPEFILTGKNPLAGVIAGDWPLRHVYRVVELTREPPGPVEFGD